ncbi:hypothetical protein PMAYCL1PPCAC_25054 [Pristionchus mayeri]|uniref:Uncharacterized protein n=1 Tax=Pristionchus mayeri TaxID=1317129 RepID=A0AAN5D1X9_9BILA|nr:hypothetical protein PMAYCL1PPCAC_25054 [Pristionchus mayeri]
MQERTHEISPSKIYAGLLPRYSAPILCHTAVSSQPRRSQIVPSPSQLSRTESESLIAASAASGDHLRFT